MSIEWIGFHDGYGIVGYGWACPNCGNYEQFAEYWEDEIKCEKCKSKFTNDNKPE